MNINGKIVDKRLIFIIALIIACFIVGISYAFFEAQFGDGANAKVDVSVEQADIFDFNVDKEISLKLDQFSFQAGTGNNSDTARGVASLTANDTKNTATYDYYVYFNIMANDFVYTTTDQKPEMILKITGPDDAVITELDGLNYVTVGTGENQVSGFDITTKSGLINVAHPTITSNSSKEATTQEWTFTVYFINLDTNQKANAGKTLNASIELVKDEKITLANYIKSLYTTQGEKGLYLHDSTLENGAGDGSYRYAGADPNNYVCFGSDEVTCPIDNLYRVIGVFGNNVKLIKDDYASKELLGEDGDYSENYDPESTYKGSQTTIAKYYWNARTANGGTANNNWNESRLNTINLNTNYLNNIGSTWSEKIEEVNWNIGVYSISNATAKTFYDAEKATTYQAKIGLMTASEYGYAASPDNWTTNLYDYDGTNVKNNNWMYIGHYDWTITRNSVYSDRAFFVSSDGFVSNYGVYNDYGVRPSFSLKSSITYVDGSGSKTDPMVIN